MLQDSWIATVHPPPWPTSSLQCVFVCVLCVCVSVRHWKGEEIDQHREERVHQQRLDGGCVREREGEKERGLSLHTPAAVSHFGQAAADRE